MNRVVIIGDPVHEGAVELKLLPVVPEGDVVALGIPANPGQAVLAEANPHLGEAMLRWKGFLF